MAFYNTTLYIPDTLQTLIPVDLNWDWENAVESGTEPSTPIAPVPNPLPDIAGEVASCMANFLEVVRFQALPANTLYEVTDNLEEMPDHKEALNKMLEDLKLQINDIAQGYASYYPQAELRLCKDTTLPIGNVELNAALRVLMVAFDAGVTSDTYQSNIKAFTITSWFQAAHSIMGAILWGAIRSPYFRTLGCNSLNGIKDHVLISKGLYRPLTHLQLLQAMSEQMQCICKTWEELDTSHITNVYNTAVKHVTSELTTLLAAHAYASLSEEDKEQQRHKALDKLDDELIQVLKTDAATCNHTIECVVNKIHDSLYTSDPSCTAGEGRAVKARVAKIKASIIADTTSHLISKREAKFMDEIEKRYNAEVAAHAAEVFKHKEANIAKEVVCLEKQTREALMESANKVIHFQVTEETKRNRRILEAKEDSDQWKLVLDIVARNRLMVVPAGTVAPSVLALDSQPNSQESILSYLDPIPTTTEIMMLELTLHKLMDKVDEMAARKGNARQTATVSIHNPDNQMSTEPTEPVVQPPTPPEAPPQDPLAAILAGITNLTTKIDGFESCLMAVKRGETPAHAKLATDPHNRPAPPIPPRPVLKQGPKGILINLMPQAPPKLPPRLPHQENKATEAMPTDRVKPATTPAEPITTEVTTTPPTGTSVEEWSMLLLLERKHKLSSIRKKEAKKAKAQEARVDDPESFPPLPSTDPNPFIIVTIMRDGGLKDEAAERAICTLNPEQIIMKARSVMEQTAEHPPFLLGGRTVKFAAIAPFGAALIGPLKRGVMVPVQGWVWTQLCNVPVSDENGIIYDSNKLTAELWVIVLLSSSVVGATSSDTTPGHHSAKPHHMLSDVTSAAAPITLSNTHSTAKANTPMQDTATASSNATMQGCANARREATSAHQCSQHKKLASKQKKKTMLTSFPPNGRGHRSPLQAFPGRRTKGRERDTNPTKATGSRHYTRTQQHT
ncbi:hypothetical protein V8E53_007500 [Lactarius tabidus]